MAVKPFYIPHSMHISSETHSAFYTSNRHKTARKNKVYLFIIVLLLLLVVILQLAVAVAVAVVV